MSDSPKTQSAVGSGNFMMGKNYRYDIIGKNDDGVLVGLNVTYGERGFTDSVTLRLVLANVDYNKEYGKIKHRSHAQFKKGGHMLDGLKLDIFSLKVAEDPMPVFLLLDRMDEYELWDAIEMWLKFSLQANGFTYTCEDLKAVLTIEPNERMDPFKAIKMNFKAPPLIGEPKVKEDAKLGAWGKQVNDDDGGTGGGNMLDPDDNPDE